jgi:hypothetical protein
MGDRADDTELSEYVARVRWIDERRQEAAFWEKGMFQVGTSWATSATRSRCSAYVRRFGATARSPRASK